MTPDLAALPAHAINLGVAVGCGALIGSERQIRQRTAGLRTNALVALGAASFVTFSALYPAEVSPTRVAAQIVSGIGFLGAGIIFRDGLTVHGLNTAATLWCAAGVGMMAGAGAWPHALVLTGLIVFVNLGLRPLVKWLKRHTRAGVPIQQAWLIRAGCAAADDAVARALLLQQVAVGGFNLIELDTRPDGDGRIELSAQVAADGAGVYAVEPLAARLAANPVFTRFRWLRAEDA